jgi:hypothetical protein
MRGSESGTAVAEVNHAYPRITISSDVIMKYHPSASGFVVRSINVAISIHKVHDS